MFNTPFKEIKSYKKVINIYNNSPTQEQKKGHMGQILFPLSREHTWGVWDKQFKPLLSQSRQTQLLGHIAMGIFASTWRDRSTTHIGILLVYGLRDPNCLHSLFASIEQHDSKHKRRRLGERLVRIYIYIDQTAADTSSCPRMNTSVHTFIQPNDHHYIILPGTTAYSLLLMHGSLS